MRFLEKSGRASLLFFVRIIRTRLKLKPRNQVPLREKSDTIGLPKKMCVGKKTICP
jgi:hypothetical protein